NYLLPRDCPRVTYYAGPQTSAADVERFLGDAKAVVAIEDAWSDRVRSCRLYCYQLPAAPFTCFDECAGYFVSRAPVTPIGAHVINDPLAEPRERGVDVRFLPYLWPLRDSVVASTLLFSMIRMRNAAPRRSTMHRP